MHKINEDEDLFNFYHKWRETFELKSRTIGESLHCYMCKQANKKQDGKKEYKHLSKYWTRKKNCELEPEPVR